MRRCILAILLMMGIAEAAYVLDAILTDTGPFAGPNCRERGGANFYDVSVAVTNPSADTTMRVSYMYYNSSSGEYENGGKACDVRPGMTEPCNLKIYTVTGGRNATDVIPFRITGQVGEFATKYEKELQVTIDHYTGSYEQNMLERIETARSEYGRVIQIYTGCYNASGLALMNNANSEIAEAESKLLICDLSATQNLTSDAINKIREAEGYLKPVSCDGSPPAGNNTPPELPQQNNTPPANETPPENGTPAASKIEENVTDITTALMKGCMPFAVLLSLLVIAVWSDRG